MVNNGDTRIGYDGEVINIGDRVELHPATDLRGARFGELVRTSITPDDAARVRLDRTGKRLYSCPFDLIRKIS